MGTFPPGRIIYKLRVISGKRQKLVDRRSIAREESHDPRENSRGTPEIMFRSTADERPE